MRLMTIHAAKGLEFGVVVVAELGRQGAGRSEDLLADDERVGLRLVGMDGEGEPAFAFAHLRDELRAADAREERRVLHVALTRAEERLILTGAADPARGWPAERNGACPLATVGPRLAGDLVTLAAGAGDGDVDVVRVLGEGAGVRVVVRRPPTPVGDAPAPATTSPSAQAPPAAAQPACEQLSLDLLAAAPHAGQAPPEVAPQPPAPASPAPPPVAGVSYSGLAAYSACPYRFYLQRHLRLPDQPPPPHLAPPAEGLDARLRGTLAHVLLERMDLAPTAPPPGPGAVRALAAELDVEVDDGDVADLLGLLSTFAASDVRARLGRAAVAAPRARLRLPARPRRRDEPDAQRRRRRPRARGGRRHAGRRLQDRPRRRRGPRGRRRGGVRRPSGGSTRWRRCAPARRRRRGRPSLPRTRPRGHRALRRRPTRRRSRPACAAPPPACSAASSRSRPLRTPASAPPAPAATACAHGRRR